jgi:hypothetical protein
LSPHCAHVYAVPWHVPVPASVPQPGHAQPLDWHSAHVVKSAVPVQAATWKSAGAGGRSDAGDLQQICPVQSLLCSQLLAQVAAQSPLQQIGDVSEPAQSEDVVHALGQVADDGLRQMPLVLRFGSRLLAEVQQISPPAVLQSVSPLHPVGHSFAGVQSGCL